MLQAGKQGGNPNLNRRHQLSEDGHIAIPMCGSVTNFVL